MKSPKLLFFGALPIFLFVFTGVYFGFFDSKKSNQSGKPLRVMAYSTFFDNFGPGKIIQDEFEKKCSCQIEWIQASDSGLVIEKLKLDQFKNVDVVIGLDQVSKERAKSELPWINLDFPEKVLIDHRAKTVIDENEKLFLPYNWAPMTIIYRVGESEPLGHIESLNHENFNKAISIQDPRTTSPGLQFLFWVNSVMEKSTSEFLKSMKSNWGSISPSWSSSYGLFKKKQVRYTFSYATSAVYHWIVEKDQSYQPMIFSHEHPYQVEYAGIPEGARSPQMAKKFIEFLLEKNSQKVIMNKNFMLPIVDGVVDGTDFEELPSFKLLSYDQLGLFLQQKDTYIKEWLETLR